MGGRDVEAPAVRFAFREAAARGCALSVLSAWRQPTPRPAEHMLITGDPAHSAEARAAALLDKALEGPARDYPDVRVSRATPEGAAAKILVERSAAADLLVVGGRQGSFIGLELGRVAHRALHHAACPVVVVPQRVTDAATTDV
ncbi:universal stress protein [Streptomyces anulatus]